MLSIQDYEGSLNTPPVKGQACTRAIITTVLLTPTTKRSGEENLTVSMTLSLEKDLRNCLWRLHSCGISSVGEIYCSGDDTLINFMLTGHQKTRDTNKTLIMKSFVVFLLLIQSFYSKFFVFSSFDQGIKKSLTYNNLLSL